MEQTEERFLKDAKELTNFLFDKGFLAEDLSREGMDVLEEYIGFLFQLNYDSAIRNARLTKLVRGV